MDYTPQVGDVVYIEDRISGAQWPARVGRINNGRPACWWVSHTKSRRWVSKPRTLKETESIVRKAAPFEAAAFDREVEAVAV
jgi:hypothetical protein